MYIIFLYIFTYTQFCQLYLNETGRNMFNIFNKQMKNGCISCSIAFFRPSVYEMHRDTGIAHSLKIQLLPVFVPEARWELICIIIIIIGLVRSNPEEDSGAL